MKLPVYLDYNATTPVDPRVLEEMLPYLTEKFGNAASRNHSYGWVAVDAVEQARKQVADLIRAEKQEIIFTSGATESDNLALKGVFEAYASKGNHIITVSTEHEAVLDSCRHLEKKGAVVTYLPVDSDGLIDLQGLKKAISENTILVSVMYANNETGVIQPIKEISAITHAHGALLMCDATQAVGKLAVDVNRDGIDLMAFTAHKMYGPKGTGALYVRRKNPRTSLIAQIDGGKHERNFRSGTLNVPGIVGFGKAAEIAQQELESDVARLLLLRKKLEQELLSIPKTKLNGHPEQRGPNTSYISFTGVHSEVLIGAVNSAIAISSGSACSSGSMESSHVLTAMGLKNEEAHTAIRFSLGRFTTEEEVSFAAETVKSAVQQLREHSPRWAEMQ